MFLLVLKPELVVVVVVVVLATVVDVVSMSESASEWVSE